MMLVLHVTVLVAVGATAAEHELCDERFLFRQLLAGRDVAQPSRAANPEQAQVFQMAKGMQNFMYLVGDREARQCVAIDACYDPEGVVAAAASLGCNITMAIGTHFHYDHIGHVGGKVLGGPGLPLPGLSQLLTSLSIPGFIHQIELATAAMQIGVAAEALSPVVDGDLLRIGGGDVSLRVIETPGHSPGGITLVVAIGDEERLVLTGDTVFPGSCGRLDLPGSSVDAMHESLSYLRETLDEALPLFPGHAYGGASSTVGREKHAGLLRPMSISQWRRMMSR